MVKIYVGYYIYEEFFHSKHPDECAEVLIVSCDLNQIRKKFVEWVWNQRLCSKRNVNEDKYNELVKSMDEKFNPDHHTFYFDWDLYVWLKIQEFELNV